MKNINNEALEKLQDEFETRDILYAIDNLDKIRCSIDNLRDDLMSLHESAQSVINDEEDDDPDEPLWEMASDIESEIDDYISNLEDINKTVSELTTLMPNEEE